ncbi:MAG: OmpA family protein [Symploca sp. SIO2E9]|nr:OmpA family protein [Symploca sp. SIO2E9]
MPDPKSALITIFTKARKLVLNSPLSVSPRLRVSLSPPPLRVSLSPPPLRVSLSPPPLLLFLGILAAPSLATAQLTNSAVVVVNSNQDGAITADNLLTFREAIAIVNGQLSMESLSEAEQAQIELTAADTPSRIEFNLPAGQTTIRLQKALPPLATPGLVVDGTTQPGYDSTVSATAEIEIPIPVVEITPSDDTQILRGLSIIADGVTVRGLSLYGFTDSRGATLLTPPADIFISHPNPPPDTTEQQPPNNDFPFYTENVPPKDIVIEDNWLGITADERMPQRTSAFGVSVFNSLGTTIQRNRIANHDGSAIITSVQAKNLEVRENIIVGNGIAGMPDAIRLEGVIDNSQIAGNLICGNDGSGVYLFKPQGSVEINNNLISFNGRRLRRAAVYLMGDNHQVIENYINNQTGPGVTVTSYPRSRGNIIESNRFARLEGLSIDLNSQQHVEPIHFQVGDGPNPPRNSPNRRKETGNAAINAPEFISSEFFVLGSNVEILGKADPGSSVEIYLVNENTDISYGPLSEAIANVETDEEGNFSLTLRNVPSGTALSAIATHPDYGTSEPALNTLVISPSNAGTSSTISTDTEPPQPNIPQCTTVPVAQEPPPPLPPPEPVVLRVPKNVHFALDKADLTPESTAILDQIIAVLKQYPFIIVELEGHTDPRASDAYNLDLGKRRALAVRNYLLREGIAPERMTIRSLGESQRRTTGNTIVDYARDRRVEFTFQDARGLEIIFEEQETDLQIESGGPR